MDEQSNVVLAHYGVKGMRWGIRRKPNGGFERTGKRIKKPIVESEDRKVASELKKKNVAELSNSELKKLNERLQLERTYSQLMGSQKSKVDQGQKFADNTLKALKTGQELYNIANSPAGKAAREALKKR